jgi:hypothetical protein
MLMSTYLTKSPSVVKDSKILS